jgi:ribosomal protein S25
VPDSLTKSLAAAQNAASIGAKYADILARYDVSGVISQATKASEQIRHIAAIAAKMNEVQGNYSKTLSRALTAYENVFKKVLKNINFESIQEQYLLVPFNILASEYGWPPSDHFPTNVPSEIATEALKLEDEQKRFEYVNEQIVGLFQGEELDLIFEGWESQAYLKGTERLMIMKAAFGAHRDGNYALSSPSILPQIEGLFLEQVEGITEPSEGEKYRINVQAYEKHIRRLSEAEVIRLVVKTGQVLYNFVQEHGLFGKDSQYNPIAYEISRHKILHGRTTAYCRRQDISLRHILWMDCVISLIHNLEPEEESPDLHQ